MSSLDQIKRAERVIGEQKQSIAATEMQPLSLKTKVAFIIFPGASIWFNIFSPKDWKQRRRDANKCLLMGLTFWFFVVLLIAFLIK